MTALTRRWPQPGNAGLTPTSRIEQGLLFATAFLLPFENFTSVAGFSVLYFAFGAVAAYGVVVRQRELFAVALESVFIAAYLLVMTCLLIETFHANSNYEELSRIAQMVGAAVAVSALCRDRAALRALVGGLLCAGVFLSATLLLTSYGRLAQMSADDFQQASSVRAQTFRGFVLADDLNRMSFLAVVAASLAMHLGLRTDKTWRALICWACAITCAVAALLPMSRGGLLMLVGLAAFVAATSGVSVRKLALGFGALVVLTLTLAPSAVFSRYKVEGKDPNKPTDGRVTIYTAAVTHFDDYWAFGVGFGNFNGPWGRMSEFWYAGERILGPHNVLIATTVYWGVMALALLLTLLATAARSLGAHPRRDVLDGCMAIVLIALACQMNFVSEFYHKENAVGLGLAAASRRWRLSWRPAYAAALSPRTAVVNAGRARFVSPSPSTGRA